MGVRADDRQDRDGAQHDGRVHPGEPARRRRRRRTASVADGAQRPVGGQRAEPLLQVQRQLDVRQRVAAEADEGGVLGGVRPAEQLGVQRDQRRRSTSRGRGARGRAPWRRAGRPSARSAPRSGLPLAMPRQGRHGGDGEPAHRQAGGGGQRPGRPVDERRAVRARHRRRPRGRAAASSDPPTSALEPRLRQHPLDVLDVDPQPVDLEERRAPADDLAAAVAPTRARSPVASSATVAPPGQVVAAPRRSRASRSGPA